MANQDGDIDALKGGNSKSSEHVRDVPRETRTTRGIGDGPQGPGCGLVCLPSPFVDWLAARTAFARRCNCVHDAIIQWREVDETSNASRVFQRRKWPQQWFRPDRSQTDKLPRRIGWIQRMQLVTCMYRHDDDVAQRIDLHGVVIGDPGELVREMIGPAPVGCIS